MRKSPRISVLQCRGKKNSNQKPKSENIQSSNNHHKFYLTAPKLISLSVSVYMVKFSLMYFLFVQTHLCRRQAPAPMQENPVTPVWMQQKLVTLMRLVNAWDLPTTPSAARPHPLSSLWPIRSHAARRGVRRYADWFLRINSEMLLYLGVGPMTCK